ncbi:MAG: protein kinase [Chloroflexi bacterium]|nr:protein kinase [Chloroflexota bacterium]
MEQVNSLLANRYRVEQAIGAGGMGTVYAGVDQHTDQRVAIKQLHGDRTQPEMIERFRREGEALRDLNHPNIVKLLDTVDEPDAHYIIMEYVSGGDLKALLTTEPLELERALNMAIDLADALTRAHRLDIVHRDLKPANVLIANDGTLRLTDFGVAHLAARERVTGTDAVIGTIDYLAPETLSGSGVDARSDIWAFGLMLFEMIAGTHPFRRDATGSTMLAIVNAPLPDLEAMRPDIPVDLIDLIYRMLERDPNARITSVRYVGAALEDILHGRGITPQPTRFASDTDNAVAIARIKLPTPPTPFVGREAEVAEVLRLIDDPNTRLVTIVAPGGMGKTRLAIETARRQAEQAGHEAVFVDLSALSDVEKVLMLIADAVDFQPQGDTPALLDQLSGYLHARKMVLVLDNFETVTEAAPTVNSLLERLPKLSVVATSRERLNLSSETVFHLAGMDLPQSINLDEAMNHSAIALFMNSAKRVRPDYELSAEDLEIVKQICLMLGGMPLGIVLAAGWVEMLSPAEVAEELQKGLDILEGDMADLPDRQHSIRAVFDYAWASLSDADQQVLRALSVFKGGFERQIAQQVTGATLRNLMSLVNKSLLRRDPNSGRYSLHELLRQFAEERLKECGQTEQVRRAHAQAYAELVSEFETARGERQVRLVHTFQSEFENIRAAWFWLVESRQLDTLDTMVEAMYRYFRGLLRTPDGAEFFNGARSQLNTVPERDDLHRAERRIMVRFLEWSPYKVEQWESIFARGKALAEAVDDRSEVAMILFIMAGTHFIRGELEPAADLLIEASDRFEALGDWHYVGITKLYLAQAYSRMRDFKQMQATAIKALETLDADGDLVAQSTFLSLSGQYAAKAGDAGHGYAMARKLFNRAIDVQGRLNAYVTLPYTTSVIGMLDLRERQLETAKSRLKETQTLLSAYPSKLGEAFSLQLAGEIALYEHDMDQAQRLFSEVRAMAQAEAFIYVRLYWQTAILALVEGDPAEAKRQLAAMHQEDDLSLLYYIDNVDEDALFGQGLADILATIAYQEGDHEQAARIVGRMAVQNENQPRFWTMSLPIFAELPPKLEEELGTPAYQAALEAGKSVSLRNVTKEMLNIAS